MNGTAKFGEENSELNELRAHLEIGAEFEMRPMAFPR